MKELSDTLVLPTHSGIATYPPGATFGPRRMTDYEFVWIIQGNAEYTWDGVTVSAPEGSMALCRPDAVDFFRWDPQNRTRHGYFHFRCIKYRMHGLHPPIGPSCASPMKETSSDRCFATC